MKLIFSMIGRHLLLFISAIFFLVIETICDLMQPMLMSYIVDKGVSTKDTGTVVYYGAIMLGVAVIGAFGAIVRNNLASRTSQKIAKEMRSIVYSRIQSLSFANIDKFQPATLITCSTNDITQVQNFINGSMRILIKAPLISIGSIILITTQSPDQIPLVGTIIFIAALFIASNIMLSYPRFTKLQKRLDKLNNISREFLSSIRVVKSFGREDFEVSRFNYRAEMLAKATISATRVTAVFGPLINLTVNIGIVALLWSSHNSNPTEVGKLMASVNYMTQILFSLSMVSMILNVMARAVASAKRVEEVLNETPAMKEIKDGKTSLSYNIEFKNVSFKYKGANKKSIENITFNISEGETVGIIGSTGSGKSTLINLIPRFYDTVEGSIFIGGIDIKEWNLQKLRQSIGIVPQKPSLFSGTIKYNIRWGKEDAPDNLINKAAQSACATEFINGLPHKFNTILGQGGVNLSGGQKQRISIARAIIRKPKILILDDCTSALDANTEKLVTEGIKSFAHGSTVILISQRISSIMTADKIILLDKGTIAALGTHKELMDLSHLYRQIYASQIGAE